MVAKVYLKTSEELVHTSQAGEKVFIEYRNTEEEIENAPHFQQYDWDFTLSAYSRLFPENYVKFFKKII
jgi:hypothetical protein